MSRTSPDRTICGMVRRFYPGSVTSRGRAPGRPKKRGWDAVPDHWRRRLHREPSCRGAARAGQQVHVLDDLSTGAIDNIRHLKAHPAFDYTIDSAAERAGSSPSLSTTRTSVYHLAAAVGVELIVESPVRTIETNVHCTEIVLAQASKKKKPVFIASTSEVYGKSARAPLPGGRRPPPRPDLHGPVVLRLLEGHRRVPGAWRIGRSAAAGRRSGGCSTRSGPRQTGRYGMVVPKLRPAGAARRADHRLRRRDQQRAASATSRTSSGRWPT